MTIATRTLRAAALAAFAVLTTGGLRAATIERGGERIGQRVTVCSARTLNAAGTWTQSHFTVAFPPRETTVAYEYRGYGLGQQLRAIVNCRIPATAEALDTMNRLLNAPSKPLATTTAGRLAPKSTTDPAYALEPLVTTACAAGYTGEYPYCYPPDYTDPEPVYYTPSGGGGSGGGGGTGGGTPLPPPPDDDPPADPCNTANPVLDTKAVQDGMKNLWKQSNANDNLAHRHEKAGWIVQKLDGSYYVFPWPTTGDFGALGGCGGFSSAQINSWMPPEGKDAIVGFVHTHPYSAGETIWDRCDGNTQDYNGHESDWDRRAGVILGNTLGRSTPLMGWVIDKEHITGFNGLYDPRGYWTRCGY